MESEIARESLRNWKNVDLNEADTRHQLIDLIIHDILSWPRSRIRCETHVNEGFADYVLAHKSNDPALIIEAKRTGYTFQIPADQNSDKLTKYVPVAQLLTDDALAEVINQVRAYAIDQGCEFAVATNGNQWVFFRAFARGKNWKQLRAFVVQSLDWFIDDYTEATNVLAFEAIERDRSLSTLLAPSPSHNREIYYPKERIDHFSIPVTTNRFARYLRPMVSRYFQNLEDAEEDFFETCYVRQREYDVAFDGLSDILKGALTPYLEEYGIQQTDDNEHGGRFGNRIVKSLRDSKSADVVVLFGGKGIGKSTFLRRLLVNSSPQFLSKHAVVARLDLLNEPDDTESLRAKVWRTLVNELDVDRILDGSRDDLLALFEDKYQTALKQTLVGIPEDSVEFNTALNSLVSGWKQDYEYCAKKLTEYWKKLHRGVVVVIDNTDQFKGETQDFCFTLAQQIASHLDSLSLISMREERFQRSRIHGVLDAFQNSGYHLSAPLPHEVFLTRLRYVRAVLNDEVRVRSAIPLLNFESDERENLIRFLDILVNEFNKGVASPLFKFLVACAHGNIRLALELFRGFAISGYTNLGEMVDVKTNLWTLKTHQVVRPLMTPHRFFYEEADSPVPNLYQLRSSSHGSHFTGLRLIRRISKGADPNNAHFVAVTDLRDVFGSTYSLADDFNGCLEMLLKYSLVEANNRIDEYSDDIDSIRVTQYGHYLAEELAHEFTYLDLSSTDCGIYSQSAANELAEFGNEDYRLFRSRQKMDRINARLAKVRSFLAYLQEQEEWEAKNLGIADEDLVCGAIVDRFEASVPEIERSAKKNVGD